MAGPYGIDVVCEAVQGYIIIAGYFVFAYPLQPGFALLAKYHEDPHYQILLHVCTQNDTCTSM